MSPWKFSVTITHGNALSVYFRDPEKNRVELLIDTPWYVPQPYRVPYDIMLPDAEVWAAVEKQVRAVPDFQDARSVGRGNRAQNR